MDEFVGGVESTTPQEVSYLGSVNQTISTIPEVKKIEHLTYVCDGKRGGVLWKEWICFLVKEDVFVEGGACVLGEEM